jgi:hypothetical protein
MKRNMVITVIILSIIFLTLTGSLLGRSLFVVSNVEISNNFRMDKNKVIDLLGIYPLRSIWKYDTGEMEERLSKQFFLQEFRVEKRYPNTLFIKMLVRQPVAKIAGMNGEIFVIDGEGVIFRKASNNDSIYPLLIMTESEKLGPGVKFIGTNKDMIDSLTEIKKNDMGLYDSLAQIEIIKINDLRKEIVINYRTFEKRLYLENSFDLASVKKGLASVLYLDEINYDYNKLFYTGTGFAVID